MSDNKCQIMFLGDISEKPGIAAVVWQRIRKLRRSFKRRRDYLINLFLKIRGRKIKISNTKLSKDTENALCPGDYVMVKSKEEIQATVNNWNQLKGCAVMEEMWPYCGTKQRVFKRVEKFLDERDYLLKRCRGIILLEGIFCEGTKDFGPCDRCCFYFWRQEWLKKIN